MTDTQSIGADNIQPTPKHDEPLTFVNQAATEFVISRMRPVALIRTPWWKRSLDLILIVLALPFLLPLTVFITLLIWIVSDGPVLFRQERVGLRGKRFVCYKFRTMFMGNDAEAHQKYLAQLITSNQPMVKMDATGDPRIIPFGRILRSSGLDELPQLINVLLGDMSVIGPRPCVPYEYENYLPWQKERFDALPGLTGLWQVSGKNKTSFEQMIQLDIKYSRNQTLAGDLAIIFKTIPVLLRQVSEMYHRQSQTVTRKPKTRNEAGGKSIGFSLLRF
jgi:lipopolysaccharide/colanic/teichoic acid biosynthesis glycosyltransferase